MNGVKGSHSYCHNVTLNILSSAFISVPAHRYQLLRNLENTSHFCSKVTVLGRVQEWVERRVERQHEDGGPDVDLARNGRASRSQQPHDAHGELAAEVGEDDEEEAAGDGRVLLATLRP